MKHTLFILLTATLLILACGETRNNDSKTDSSRAERIADSLRDYNQLNLWVDRFDSIGDHKAQLLIRQKLGKVMRDTPTRAVRRRCSGPTRWVAWVWICRLPSASSGKAQTKAP